MVYIGPWVMHAHEAEVSGVVTSEVDTVFALARKSFSSQSFLACFPAKNGQKRPEKTGYSHLRKMTVRNLSSESSAELEW